MIQNVMTDNPMVVSDPLGGFYYLWWCPFSKQLLLAPECLEMRKIIGQTYDAHRLENTVIQALEQEPNPCC